MKDIIRRLTDSLISLRSAVLVGALTIMDLVGVLLNCLHSMHILKSRFFNLARDRGFTENIQYIKFGIIILVLGRWNKTRPSKLLFAWLILFTAMLIDDAVGIHEAVGGLILSVTDIPVPEGVRSKDVAEAAVFALVEGSCLAYVAFRYFQAPADLRSYSRWLVLAMVPLVTFGCLFDFLPFHNAEQVGEMLGMTVLLAFVHWHFRTRSGAFQAYGASQTTQCTVT